MQPEPTEISEQLSDTTNTQQVANTSQHGFQPSNLQPHGSFRGHDGQYAVPMSATGTATGSSDPLTGTREQLRRLNTRDVHGPHPKPTVRRISEYESALAPAAPKSKNEGPYFKVVKTNNYSSDGPQLEDFPNEVLTHILSHLPPSSLLAASLVSRRFYNLVTTPHPWRTAFSRYFPGQDAIDGAATSRTNRRNSDQEPRENLRAEQRYFTCLTAVTSWRSEYMLRTRLLRSLQRGKPVQFASGHGVSNRHSRGANKANAVVTYNSQLFATVNHIHATFTSGNNSPRFIHGADETGTACTSDPNVGKIDNWGLSDPQSLPQFSDLFPGDQPYGLGEGLLVGVPNVMDVSQPFGMVYGEGFPGGQTYFRASDEMRGRFLNGANGYYDPKLGIPKIPERVESICSVWIAKSQNVPSMTSGLIGMMTGSSFGAVTAYSLGADNLRDHRLNKGEITAKWMLSPGIPIVAISVDDSYSVQRKTSSRIWAVAMNALGEVYYLTETPSRRPSERFTKLDGDDFPRIAWDTGRTVYWNVVEPTRRVAREDPYQEAHFDGSYSPRSSSKRMDLSEEQLIAETREIEKFLALHPAHFRKVCEGWDMRRRMEVDFGGDDGNSAGENIVVIDCGVEENSQVQIRRFMRFTSEQSSFDDYPVPKTPPTVLKTPNMASLFGGGTRPTRTASVEVSPKRSTSPKVRNLSRTPMVEEWRTSRFSMQGRHTVQVTTSAIDMSSVALLTISEYPPPTSDGTSLSTTTFSNPEENTPLSLGDVPGYRARFIAVGTNTGSVLIWNMRGPQTSNPELINELQPLRIIQTESPKISCLALTALYIVHGGNDGLVQAWDPLAAQLQPLRTLNSRFSSIARRRIVQAEASVQGIGINLFAAGAVALDPDPTVLRGMVSLGTHLRYWSYSSTGADHYSSKKRRLRRPGERGSNSGPDKFNYTGRGALKDYIATEQEELRKEKLRRSREEARLLGRFGVGLGGFSDEEALRYAEMISEESYEEERKWRSGDAGYQADDGESSSQDAWSSETVTPEGSIAGHIPSPKHIKDDDFDYDIEEAIRLSLLDGVDDGGRSPRASGSGSYDIPVIFKEKKRSRRSASSSPSSSVMSESRRKLAASKQGGIAVDDWEFALKLSLAEEESRWQAAGDQDVASSIKGKEKK